LQEYYEKKENISDIRQIIKELDLDDKVYKFAEVFGKISRAKNNLITPQKYRNDPDLLSRDERARKPMIAEIFRIYAARCFKAGAMDFDDLLVNTEILFRNFPKILKEYRDQFRYILVDEYQDTNYVQYKIINRLAEVHNNVCVVGDDAQSIYSFRGAKIENILNFRNNYPGYSLYKLERNYRSTQNIVNAANSVIAKNEGRIPKKVYSRKETGEKIQVIAATTDTEEGFIISNSVFDNALREKNRYSKYAVLYRTNAQSRILEEAFRKRNIPYKVYGGLSFYQRKEIKDLLAYFRLMVNHNDEEALKRIINYPARGIGKTSLDKILKCSVDNNVATWEVITTPDKYKIGINKGIQKRISSFAGQIDHFTSLLKKKDAYDLAKEVALKTGILKDLHDPDSPEIMSKYDNVQELLNGIREFTSANTSEENEIPGLAEYLQNVSLLTDQDTETKEDKEKVTLMTVHSAKGLEFEYIYVAGLEENLFPSYMSVDDPKDLEEERRLFYVAVTRAEKQVYLCFAATRYRYGTLENPRPSRFIREIDDKYLDWININNKTGSNGFIRHKSTYSQKGYKKHYLRNTSSKKSVLNWAPPGKVKLSKSNFYNLKADDPVNIQPGMVVEHNNFGIGKVLSLEGVYPDTKATVSFQNHGKKRLLLKFAKLKIVNN
jgi:DNA helicase-2/ATP-dependent DNA helicase PcrA